MGRHRETRPEEVIGLIDFIDTILTTLFYLCVALVLLALTLFPLPRELPALWHWLFLN